MENIKTISDLDLLEICKKYGLRAKKWKKRFAGLLPEIAKRKLYEKKGCTSIAEFAAKFGGINKAYTSRVLKIHRGLEHTPKLQHLLESGKVSVHILSRVVSVATLENESFLTEQVQTLPKSALETLVRDIKRTKNHDHDGFKKPQTDHESVPGHRRTNNLFSGEVETTDCENCSISDIEHKTKSIENTSGNGSNQDDLAPVSGLVPSSILKLQLSEIVIQKLLELQVKGIDINEFILKMLEQREQEIAKEKETIAAELKPTNSRYIPRKIGRIIEKEHGKKCAVPTCSRPSEELHHTNRFALSKTHDPHFLAPLCRDHHKIAHNIDLKYYECRKPKD